MKLSLSAGAFVHELVFLEQLGAKLVGKPQNIVGNLSKSPECPITRVFLHRHLQQFAFKIQTRQAVFESRFINARLRNVVFIYDFTVLSYSEWLLVVLRGIQDVVSVVFVELLIPQRLN